MNSKNTKRALLGSVVAMLVCFSMLLSTTFAWFTDTAVSGSNVIVSGKLDVALVDANGASLEGEMIEWATADNRAQDEILWEPGCTYETEPFYVKNNGNLALKYQVVINGIEGDAKLLEAIEWTVTVGDATTALADLKGELLAGASTGAIVLSGHMKEDAGNEYQDLTVNGISVSVFATQLDAESDSFGPDYDEDAVYGDYFVTDAAALADAFANAENGDVIALMADMVLTEKVAVAKGKAVTLNLNGNDVSLVAPVADVNGDGSITSADNQMIFQVKGDLEVVGEGTVSMKHTGDNMGWNALSAVFSVEGGTLTLGEGVVVAHKGGTDMAFAVDVNTTLGNTTLNVDGALLSSTYTAVRLFNFNGSNKATVNYNSGIVDGTKRDIWRQADGPAAINIADSIAYTTDDGAYIYTFTASGAVVENTTELTSAIKNDSTIIVSEGEYTLPTLAGKSGVTLVGTEGTVVGGESTSTGFGGNFGKDTTIKNITFSGATNGVRWSYAQGGTSVFENCTFAGDSTYGFHIDESNGATFIFNNCTFSGFNAFAGDLTKVVFNNCTFLNNGNYGHTNIWSVGEFNNCTFGAGTSVGPGGTSAVVTIDGVQIDGVVEF